MPHIENRARKLNEKRYSGGAVVYWMRRDQRVEDNWALLFAAKIAAEKGVPLYVLFCLVPQFPGAVAAHYRFMLEGLKETSEKLRSLGIPFSLLKGDPAEEVSGFVAEHKAGALITDFDPLKIKRAWKLKVASKIELPFYEVDAHNIVPCRVASDKQEWAAYTLRPKINRLLPSYLKDFPELRKQLTYELNAPIIDWEKELNALEFDSTSTAAIGEFIKPGAEAGRIVLREFITGKLERYPSRSNDPLAEAESNLSPYLHFGQISAQRVALEVNISDAPKEAKDAFLEQLIIRRELADNFCFYNQNYDSTAGFPDWARKTLEEHRSDNREFIYTREEFEKGKTHDLLWNAAQMEMVKRGKMHGYMRMYWAKKMLEWSGSPEDALKTAIYLNDRYELDGRDPNGYTGIAWCIGGVHDRAWKERAVFGKIRYMSYEGCRRKFDVDAYIEKIKNLS